MTSDPLVGEELDGDRAPVLIGQLTDTHVLAVDDTETETFVDNNARLADAIASIESEPVPLRAVVATGDLTNDARPGEYDALGELLSGLSVPLLALPGNHDEPDELRQRFPDTPWAPVEHASWCTEIDGVRVVGLDSTRRGEHGGEVDPVRAGWLDAVLGVPHDGVTLLAMHHPPFESGIDWMDRDFPGVDLLGEVLRARPVAKILCGHLHRPITSTFAGIPAQVGVSTVQHVALDLRAGARPAVSIESAGYQIHAVEGGGLVTHTRHIRTGPPVTPSWAATDTASH